MGSNDASYLEKLRGAHSFDFQDLLENLMMNVPAESPAILQLDYFAASFCTEEELKWPHSQWLFPKSRPGKLIVEMRNWPGRVQTAARIVNFNCRVSKIYVYH